MSVLSSFEERHNTIYAAPYAMADSASNETLTTKFAPMATYSNSKIKLVKKLSKVQPLADHARSALDGELHKYGNAGLYSVASINGKDSLLNQARLVNPTPAQVNKRVLASHSNVWIPSLS